MAFTSTQLAAGVALLIVIVGCLHALRSSGPTPRRSHQVRRTVGERSSLFAVEAPSEIFAERRSARPGSRWLIILVLIGLLLVGWLVWPLLSRGTPTSVVSPTPQTVCTPAFIERILKQADSPAQGQGVGEAMYRRGAQYRIDPCLSLAFFHHESSYGQKGIAYTTHSIGNIRCVPGWPRCINGFKFYLTWVASVDDWFKLIDAYRADGLDTLPKIIHRYAPSSDGNNEAAYVQAVQADLARWKGENK